MKNKLKIVAALALLSLCAISAAQAHWEWTPGHTDYVNVFVNYPWPHMEVRAVFYPGHRFWVPDPVYPVYYPY